MKKLTLRILQIFLFIELIRPAISEGSYYNFLQMFEEDVGKMKIKLNPSKKYLEDAILPTDRIIKKYGYPIETHFVTTEDGYELQLHRIPRQDGKPILLQHGLLDSSAAFVVTGPEIAPAYYLWDQGYDVWLGNIRGNKYSRSHKSLNPHTGQFWDFTFHEMGIYDLPAMIDYILHKSQYTKLTYVGHSQGTTIFFVMCSKRPEYNEKVKVMHALAPIAFSGHVTSPLLPLTSLFLKSPLSNFIHELNLPQQFLQSLCFTQDKLDKVCLNMMFMGLGRDSGHLNVNQLPVILGHFPAGTSLKDVRHFVQLAESNKFREYDFGANGNLEKYGQRFPPNYDMSNIRVPISLYCGDFDKLSVPTDVKQLEMALGVNVVGKFKQNFNHIDFLWATDIRETIYNNILSINKYLE